MARFGDEDWHRDVIAIWAAVDQLIDAAPDLTALFAHRLEALAARRWRARGRELPPQLAYAERLGAVIAVTAPVLLARVRDACDGQLVIVKGPEAAAFYPDPSLRMYGDLDLLVADAPRVQRQLLEAGFEEVGDPRRYGPEGPHGRPLRWPDLPLAVEVHSRPNWPLGHVAPPIDELLAVARPSSLGVDGVLTLPPAYHAVLIAAHAWTHGPMARVRDVVEVLAVADGLPPDEPRALAERWDAGRLWDTTTAVGWALVGEQGSPRALRVWARNLRDVRERTVLESHFALWVAGFSALPPRRALGLAVRRIAADVRPKSGERWDSKLRRSRKAVRNAFSLKSSHDESIDPEREGGARLAKRRRDD